LSPLISYATLTSIGKKEFLLPLISFFLAASVSLNPHEKIPVPVRIVTGIFIDRMPSPIEGPKENASAFYPVIHH
jgi:hypothetical protein